MEALKSIQDVPDNVVNRIKKLLRKSEVTRNDSEAEAELCMQKAQELMAQWNIDMSAAEASGADVVEKRVREQHERAAMYKYQRELWRSVAQVNFCLYFTVPIYKNVMVVNDDWTGDQQYAEKIVSRRHCFMGRESNVSATKLMGDYLEEAINRECPYKGSTKSAISWKEGCASKLTARLYDRMWALQEENRAKSKVSAADGAVMLLSDVYTSEYEMNIDAEYGAGTSARWRADRIARKEQQKLQDERRDMVMDCPEAFTAEEYKQVREHFAKIAHQEKAHQRRRGNSSGETVGDLRAWWSGRKAGEDISLDPQIKSAVVEKSRRIA